MRKIIMDSKIKIMIGVLVVGIILIGTWQAWEMGILNIVTRSCHQDSDCIGTCTFGCINRNSIYNEKIRCMWVSECKCIDNRCVEKEPTIVITTAKEIEEHVNREVNVIGVLYCYGSKTCGIKFEDGTKIALSNRYLYDTGYEGQKISLIAQVDQCNSSYVQCPAGSILLTNVRYVRLASDPFENPAQPAQPKCEPDYLLDDEHKLIPDRQTHPEDLKIIQRFNVRKECLDGSKVKEIWILKPEPEMTDSAYEKLMYCESENKFLVVKSFGIAGANFYLYEGKPCK